jgi:steroid delta-isomerase-like uncharacterized protein
MGHLQDLVGQFYGAFNRGDMDAAEACFAPDVITVDPASGERRGAEAWRAYGETFKHAMPDAKLNLRSAVEAGDRIAVEGTFTGTFTGPLRTPEGEAPPNGKAFSLDYMEVFTIRGDRIASQHVYYDQVAFLGQLGLMPEGALAD